MLCRGKVIAETAEQEDIVYAHIGEPGRTRFSNVEELTERMTDPKVFDEARAGIPVTTQRRFDVYPDVSKGL